MTPVPKTPTLLVLLFMATIIAWGDRVNLSVAAPEVMREFGWDKLTMGLVFSAFTWGMVVCLFPAGWLADRFGGLKVFTLGAFFWSISTLLVPLTRGLLGLSLARALLGVSEATYQPGQVAITSQLFPRESAGKIIGLLASGTPVGLMVATPASAWLMSRYGWRTIFYVFGSLGLLWCMVVMLVTRGDLSGGRDSARDPSTQQRESFSLRHLFRSRQVLGIALFQIINMYCFWMFINWLPTYLVEARGFEVMKMGLATVVPYSATFLAYVATGWISDRLFDWGLSRLASRKIFLYIGSIGLAISIALAASSRSAIQAIFYLAGTLALLGANATVLLTLPVDLVRERAGAIVGFTGFVGFAGALAAPIVTGYIVERTQRWEYALYFAALLAVAGFPVARSMIVPIQTTNSGERPQSSLS